VAVAVGNSMPVTSLAQRPGPSVDMVQQHTAASGVRRDELLVSSSHGTASRLSPRRTNEECVVDIPDASDAMLCPVPSEFGMVSFDIERIWGGFGTGPWLTEQLGMKLYRAGTDELVLSAKRRGADYLISTFADNPRNANHFAVLRSNVTRTEFRLLGLPRGAEKAHEKGAKGKAAWNGYSNGVPPVELAAITYERNLRGDCPRKLTVVTRGFDEKGRRVHTPTPTSSSDASGLLEALRAGRWQGLNTFATKAPRWNPVQGRYEGSFTDRVKQASVRNFQLVLPAKSGEEVLLQFGKSRKHRYSLDCIAPLAPVEAFAAAITSFEAWGLYT